MDTMFMVRALIRAPHTFAEYSAGAANVQIRYLGKQEQAGEHCFSVTAELAMSHYEGSHTLGDLFSVLQNWGFHTVVDWKIKEKRDTEDTEP